MEARFRSKASKVWKTVAIRESQVNLLRVMRRENVGTRNIEEFVSDLRGEKMNSKGAPSLGGEAMSKAQNKQKYKKISTQKNHKQM